jgi:hypothetical protein
MKKLLRLIRSIFYINIFRQILLIFSICQFNTQAQDSSKNFLLSPTQLKAGSLNTSVGISLTVIPRLIAEEGVLQLPMLDVRAKYGITDEFYLSGRANIVYVTNQITAGAGWSFSYKNFSFSISDHFGYWFGFADFKGFDASSMGLANYPAITLGLTVNELNISLSGEALFTLAQHTFFGTASVGRFRPEYVGYAITLAVEEELWKGNWFLFGARFQYSLPLYQTWVAFSTSNRWALFPEFFIGYEL